MPQTIPTIINPNLLKTVRRGFDMIARIYTKSQPATVDAGTFAFMFTNIGNRAATVNGMLIYPGEVGTSLGDSRTVSTASADLEYKGKITIAFTGAGNNPSVEVVTLFYI